MSKLGVNIHKIKNVARKYAFELTDVPKEAEYLKLMYPYSSKLVFSLIPYMVGSWPYRLGSAHRSSGRNVFPRLRNKHCSVRAIRSLEKYHGPVLA